MSDVFLSYAREDKARIEPLVEALRKHGWTIWWDRTILAGKVWDREIEEAIAGSRCVVVAWSKKAIESDWVRAEAHEAMRRGVLVPVLLDAVTIPLAFRRFHAADLSDWPGDAKSEQISELARAVSAVLDGKSERVKEADDGTTKAGAAGHRQETIASAQTTLVQPTDGTPPGPPGAATSTPDNRPSVAGPPHVAAAKMPQSPSRNPASNLLAGLGKGVLAVVLFIAFLGFVWFVLI